MRRVQVEHKRPRPAAGLLLRYTDADGDWYLLGKRHRKLGGTWANIGGSLQPGEAPLEGALREFEEELGIDLARLARAEISDVVECGDERVPYTLFVLDVPDWFGDARLSWENTALYWWHAADIDTLLLHRGFARAWGVVRRDRASPEECRPIGTG
jgi:8-oxo-dGTP diphosphatase